MSAPTDRISRLAAAIGPCASDVDQDEQLASVLRMLDDGPALSLVLLNRLKERLA